MAADRNKKQVIFKNWALPTDCISETNSINIKDFDAVMPMQNVIEYNSKCSKKSRSLQQYCRDEPDDNITDYW